MPTNKKDYMREYMKKMRKAGDKGAPTAKDFKNAAKTAKKKKGKK